MSTDQKHRSRDYTVDVMRAVAVILMIFAHTSFFVYSGTNVMANTAIRFANTITLSLFVFISGISAAKSIRNSGHISHVERNIKMAEYGLILYFSYVAVSLVSLLTAIQHVESSLIPGKILEILLFTSPPNFTEYMFLFMFLPFIALPFSHAIRTKSFDTFHAVVLSVVCYISGYVLYTSTVTGPLASLKELIAGGSTLLRFPLLFYIPVYVFGIWWESNRSVRAILIGTAFTLICHLVSIIFTIPSLAIDVRWPPSIGFLSIGILSSMLLSYAVSYEATQQKLSAVYRYLHMSVKIRSIFGYLI
jgi:hypothetical protein